MLNSLEFTKRLQEIITYYELTASLFADKVGVQRSSISHIISGRNKPSLDFVLKITSQFKEVEIDWLLKGEGVFPKKGVSKTSSIAPIISSEEKNAQKKIQRIVVFYVDGTFEEYAK